MKLPKAIRPSDLVDVDAYKRLQKGAADNPGNRDADYITQRCAWLLKTVESFEQMFHNLLMDEIILPGSLNATLTPLGNQTAQKFMNLCGHFFAARRMQQNFVSGKSSLPSLPLQYRVTLHIFMATPGKPSDYCYVPSCYPSSSRCSLWGFLYLRMFLLGDPARRLRLSCRARRRAAEFLGSLLVVLKLNLRDLSTRRVELA